MNGYAKPCPIGYVRADVLEVVAGYPDHEADKELNFAISAVDVHDPTTLRWLAVLASHRADRLEPASPEARAGIPDDPLKR